MSRLPRIRSPRFINPVVLITLSITVFLWIETLARRWILGVGAHLRRPPVRRVDVT